MSKQKPFWERIALPDMTDEQWESLCDGCGRCCLQKLEDEDSGEIVFTRVSCRLLDTQTCRCSDYHHRFEQVEDCLLVRPLTPEKISWLPDSCAYKKLSQGKPLDAWHPLISGSKHSVREAGISVAGQCITETHVPLAEYFQYLIHWDNNDAG